MCKGRLDGSIIVYKKHRFELAGSLIFKSKVRNCRMIELKHSIENPSRYS